MSDIQNNGGFQFDLPKNQSSEIKVIGVGGGGSNAVNYMFHQGIHGVDFVVCNTDAQALSDSPVPVKVQLGVTLTEGLGAGANPEIGQKSAEESVEDVRKVLSSGTKMAFITAGMGGGTGTGAAPIIAKLAREMDVLTVGIVTMPFTFEGTARKRSAEAGIEALRENVDSLIVINNDKLRAVYGNLGFKQGFGKANEVLATAARGIAEVITQHYRMNIDLNDAKTVLSNSGTAIMGSAEASGESRAIDAVRKALDSPLLNDNHIVGAKNVLLLIISGTEEITFDEIGEINDFIQQEAGGEANIIMGMGDDEELEEKISVTVIATGFDANKQVRIAPVAPKKVVHQLDANETQASHSNATPLSNNTPAQESEQPIAQANKTVVESAQPVQQTPAPEPEAPKQVLQEPQQPEEPQASLPSTEPVVKHQLQGEEEQEEETSTNEPVLKPSAMNLAESGLLFDMDADLEPSMKEQPKPTEVEPKQATAGDRIVFSLHDEDEDLDETIEEEIVAENRLSPQSKTTMESPVEPIRENAVPQQNMQQPQAAQPTSQQAKQEPEAPKPDVVAQTEEKDAEDGHVDPLIEQRLQRARERQARLKAFNYRYKNMQNGTGSMDNEPAYKRMGVDLDDVPHSSKNNVSRYTLGDEESGLRSNNSFLHDNVD